jgi:hypothetical protein
LGTSDGTTDGTMVNRSKTSICIVTIAVEVRVGLNENHGCGDSW